MRFLLVEDDADLVEYIRQGLQEAGHGVRVAGNGRTGLFLAAGDDWDLLIMDRMLPQLDGVKVVRTLRSLGINTPVLFLTALRGVEDRVAGLNTGGNDYLVKPFAFAEFVARVEALGRRRNTATPDHLLRVADLEMDLLTRSVHRGSAPVELQPREFSLLEYLMRHAEKVVTRAMLLERVWRLNFDPHTKVVECAVSRLRGKIDKDREKMLIQTVRGSGYRLSAG